MAEGHALGTQAAGPTLPQSRQLSPPHPCPEPQGCLPTCGLGSQRLREPRKSKRQQLLNHGSPFIAQPSRAWRGKDASTCPRAQPDPASRSTGQGGRSPGSRREPHHVPSAPHTGAAARARVPDSPGWVDEAMEAMCRGRGTVPSSAGHFCSPWHTPAFTQPSGRACTRS